MTMLFVDHSIVEWIKLFVGRTMTFWSIIQSESLNLIESRISSLTQRIRKHRWKPIKIQKHIWWNWYCFASSLNHQTDHCNLFRWNDSGLIRRRLLSMILLPLPHKIQLIVQIQQQQQQQRQIPQKDQNQSQRDRHQYRQHLFEIRFYPSLSVVDWMKYDGSWIRKSLRIIHFLRHFVFLRRPCFVRESSNKWLIIFVWSNEDFY